MVPFTMQYGFFRFGVGFNGVDWKEIDGLDISTMRTGNSGRPRDQGEFTGYDFFGGRDLIFKGDVAGGGDPNPLATVQQNINIIGSVFQAQGNIESSLYLWLPGLAGVYQGTGPSDGSLVHGPYATGPGATGTFAPMTPVPVLTAMGKPGNRSWKIDLPFSKGYFAQDIQLLVHCTDPRFYQFPTLTQSFVSTPVTITNNGNWDCRPIVYLLPPVGSGTVDTSNPSLQINSNVMTWGGGITNQQSGANFLLVDLYNQTVTQYSAPHMAWTNTGDNGNALTALDGTYTLTGSTNNQFAGFAAAGTCYLQTNRGLAMFSYTGQGGTGGNTTLTGCKFLSGNYNNGLIPNDASSGVTLISYGMIMQDAAGGIQLTQTPFPGALKPAGGHWNTTNLGALLPGDNTIKTSNCFGFINWASAWIL
jgi:hypothetical protein